jgi:hypothetical protein
MLPLRLSSIIGTNVFGEIWTTHISLSSSGSSFNAQTPRFHTQGSMQGLEIDLDEHRKVGGLFQ